MSVCTPPLAVLYMSGMARREPLPPGGGANIAESFKASQSPNLTNSQHSFHVRLNLSTIWGILCEHSHPRRYSGSLARVRARTPQMIKCQIHRTPTKSYRGVQCHTMQLQN